MGFFADVGPLQVFVSQQVRSSIFLGVRYLRLLQLIHPDVKYDPTSNPPSFASEDQVNSSVKDYDSFFSLIVPRLLRKAPKFALKS